MRNMLWRALAFALTGGPGLALAVSASAQYSFYSITLDHPIPQINANFGTAVAGAGDVDGDTVPDLLVGAQWQDVGENHAQGLVFVFSGADGSLLRTLDNPTPQPYAGFGEAVAGAGDVDGDGAADLLVSASGHDVGGSYRSGQAFVFSGAEDSRLLRTLNNPTPQHNAYFGAAVAGAGDIDGDTVPDLLVGAFGQDVGGSYRSGQAFVFSGAEDSRLLRTLNDPDLQDLAGFGVAVAGAGDIDGDTVPDLLVGASEKTIGGNYAQGQAFVFSGAEDSRLLHTLNDPAPQERARFGSAVAGVGDVDGDTVPDLLVGASRKTIGENYAQGQAFVFSGADGIRLLTLENPKPQSSTGFGWAVAGAGDVDGDGAADLLVGAPWRGVGENYNQGQAFVFSGADGSLLLTLVNPNQQGRNFGWAVAGAGDVNADGAADLLVGAPSQDVGSNYAQGQAFLFVSAPAVTVNMRFCDVHHRDHPLCFFRERMPQFDRPFSILGRLGSFSKDEKTARVPAYLSDIDRAIFVLLATPIRTGFTKDLRDRIETAFEKAPTGPYYQKRLKASLRKDLRGFKDITPKLVLSLAEAANAVTLDLSVPPVRPAKVEAGKYAAVDFQSVAWLAFREVDKPGTASLKIKAGVPGQLKDFTPAWPTASYDFDFTGAQGRDGYVDISFYVGGLNYGRSRSTPRVLEWDGKSYQDITTGFDRRRNIVTGRTSKLATYVIAKPVPSREATHKR